MTKSSPTTIPKLTQYPAPTPSQTPD